MVGKTLGHYEILEPLGAGGMGEVYRARDTTLKREVAIKVLPEELSADPDRLARLEREAHLLAALNHPNIATIHALEEDQGARFLVLELVKGESLEQKLATGPLPVEKALDVCKQIAEALEAAHGEGIIHRDLKPANVLVTPDGRAKVLDFGIAKSTKVGVEVAETAKATDLTLAGTLVGTPPYMSPEQVRGESIDKRADIWAFGCVLYEMLTGRSAFAKETMADTLAAIVDQDPDWNALPNEIPRQVRHLIKRCLRKDSQRRLRDIADARIEIEDSLSGDTDAVSAMLAAPAVVETTRAIPWKLAALMAVASALLAAFGVWITGPSPPESLIRRFYIDYPPETTFQIAATLGVAISPDGRSVVFNANRRLWLRAIDDLVAAPIRGTEQASVPFFSPDGQQLGFWGGDGQMKSVSITGGAPVSLGPAPERAFGASWADDGYIYFGQGAGGILRVSANGGDPQVVVQMEEGEQAHGPQLLPRSEWLLFTLLTGSGSWNAASIVAQPVSGGEPKLLVAGGTDGRYVPTGHIVYSLAGNLFAVPFDADSIEVTGAPVSIVEGIQQAFGGVTGASQFAFSDRGGLVYMPGGGASGAFQLVWVDRDGQVGLLPFEPRSSQNLALSPDGQRIALQIQGDDGESDIWIYEVERGGSQVLLTTEGNNQYPVWSPDGEWVFFTSNRSGNYDIWKRRADRSLDAEQVLTTAADDVRPSSISADGERLLFDSGLFPNRDVGMLALDTDQEPEMLVATAADELQGSFSPDGRFFAFESNETGQREVMVRELSNGRTFPVSTSTRGGVGPRWSRDGTEIYYRSRIGSGILVAEVAMEPFSASDPLELLAIIHRSGVHFDVTADGQRFLVTVPTGGGDAGNTAPAARLNVILNWFEELKRLVPTSGSQ